MWFYGLPPDFGLLRRGFNLWRSWAVVISWKRPLPGWDISQRLLLPAFGKTFKDLEATHRKETRLHSDPAPSVFLICLEEGQALNQNCCGLGGLQRLKKHTPKQKTKEQQQKKTPKLHIWRRKLGSLLLKWIPKTQCLGAGLSTHKRSWFLDPVQGSPK